MDIAYDTVTRGSWLNEVETYAKLFEEMAQQTIECGYFIEDYLKRGFCKLLVPYCSRTYYNDTQSQANDGINGPTDRQLYRRL